MEKNWLSVNLYRRSATVIASIPKAHPRGQSGLQSQELRTVLTMKQMVAVAANRIHSSVVMSAEERGYGKITSGNFHHRGGISWSR